MSNVLLIVLRAYQRLLLIDLSKLHYPKRQVLRPPIDSIIHMSCIEITFHTQESSAFYTKACNVLDRVKRFRMREMFGNNRVQRIETRFVFTQLSIIRDTRGHRRRFNKSLYVIEIIPRCFRDVNTRSGNSLIASLYAIEIRFFL